MDNEIINDINKASVRGIKARIEFWSPGNIANKLEFRHTSGNRISWIMYYEVNGQSNAQYCVPSLFINFDTSDRNYWYIRYSIRDGGTFTIPDNFYCSVTDSDRSPVSTGINHHERNYWVQFTSSSGCNKSIEQV